MALTKSLGSFSAKDMADDVDDVGRKHACSALPPTTRYTNWLAKTLAGTCDVAPSRD